MLETLAGGLIGEGAEVPAGLSAEAAAQMQIPVISAAFEGNPTAYLPATARNGPYVSYYGPDQRGIIMRGFGVARSQGLAQDLLGVRYQINDPVANPRPLESWPGQVDRSYQFHHRDLFNYEITLTCVFQRGPRQNLNILDKTHEVVRVGETCRNHRRTVENVYFVEPETGTIWRSRQWIGPQLRQLTVSTITPAR